MIIDGCDGSEGPLVGDPRISATTTVRGLTMQRWVITVNGKDIATGPISRATLALLARPEVTTIRKVKV